MCQILTQSQIYTPQNKHDIEAYQKGSLAQIVRCFTTLQFDLCKCMYFFKLLVLSAIHAYSIKNQIKHVTKRAVPISQRQPLFDVFGAHFVFVGFVCVCCVLHFCLFWEGWYLTSISLNDIHVFSQFQVFAFAHRRIKYSSFHLSLFIQYI